MSKKRGPVIQEEVSPNLIPMIDIMFLLLLFFMLGADMGQRELEEVLLPKAKSVKEDKESSKKDTTKDRLTINVYHKYDSGRDAVKCNLYKNQQVCREPGHWVVGIRGSDFLDGKKGHGEDAFLERLKKEAAQAPDLTSKGPNPLSDRKVMIRADDSAPYGRVQVVMNACAKAGMYKIEVGAAQPAAEKKRE